MLTTSYTNGSFRNIPQLGKKIMTRGKANTRPDLFYAKASMVYPLLSRFDHFILLDMFSKTNNKNKTPDDTSSLNLLDLQNIPEPTKPTDF